MSPRSLVAALGLLLPLALLVGNWQTADMSRETQVRTAWEIILRQPLPQGATLVSNDRDEMTPMWYLQYVEGVRRDLVGLFPKITPDAAFTTIGSLLDWLLARGQRPYLIKPMPGLEIKYRLQQAGLLGQVTGYSAPPALQPERPSGASLDGQVKLLGADLQGSLAPGSVVTVTLYWTPESQMDEAYHSFVQLTTANGMRLAGSDHRPGGDFYATPVWGMGDVLVDRHVVTIPATLGAGAYRLKAGMYSYPSLKRLPVSGSNETAIDLGPVLVP